MLPIDDRYSDGVRTGGDLDAQRARPAAVAFSPSIVRSAPPTPPPRPPPEPNSYSASSGKLWQEDQACRAFRAEGRRGVPVLAPAPAARCKSPKTRAIVQSPTASRLIFICRGDVGLESAWGRALSESAMLSNPSLEPSAGQQRRRVEDSRDRAGRGWRWCIRSGSGGGARARPWPPMAVRPNRGCASSAFARTSRARPVPAGAHRSVASWPSGSS